MADIDRARGKYQARWRDTDGRQRTRLFPTRREAADHLAQVRVAARRGVEYQPRGGLIQVRDYAPAWLRTMRHLRPSSAELYASHVRTWIVPELGDRKLAGISRGDCKLFVATLDAHLAPATVATVYAVLSRMMAHAVDEGKIPVNPCLRVPLPAREHRVIEPLPAEAVSALAAAITPRYEVAVWLGAGAGLREGEALGLLASRVDFLRRRIHVVEQMQGRKLSPLKTKSSQRIVPVDDLVISKIAEHLLHWGSRSQSTRDSQPTSVGLLLITNRLGQPVQRNSFGHCWREAVAAAGVPAGTRFHDLRHFYASALIRSGLNVREVQARLGHATATETLNTYAHLWPDQDERGRGAIEVMFGELRATQEQAR